MTQRERHREREIRSSIHWLISEQPGLGFRSQEPEHHVGGKGHHPWLLQSISRELGWKTEQMGIPALPAVSQCRPHHITLQSHLPKDKAAKVHSRTGGGLTPGQSALDLPSGTGAP